jgi:hypothetical protein
MLEIAAAEPNQEEVLSKFQNGKRPANGTGRLHFMQG